MKEKAVLILRARSPKMPNPDDNIILDASNIDTEIIFMEMSCEEAVKLVVSGGIVTPPDGGKAASALKAAKKSAKKVTTKKFAKKASAKKAVVKKATPKKATTS